MLTSSGDVSGGLTIRSKRDRPNSLVCLSANLDSLDNFTILFCYIISLHTSMLRSLPG